MGRSAFEPLIVHLAAQRQEIIPLSIAEIEEIIDAILPGSAHRRHWYWRDGGSHLVRELTDAGWEARLIPTQRAVAFRRVLMPSREQ
jgi:hypothetical protein